MKSLRVVLTIKHGSMESLRVVLTIKHGSMKSLRVVLLMVTGSTYRYSLYLHFGGFNFMASHCIPDSLTCTKLAASNVSGHSAEGPGNAGTLHPIGRRGHTAVVYGSSMLVYGGYVDMKGSSSELWKFNFGNHILKNSILC